MVKRIVSSIRIDEDLVQKALALGLKISRISEEAVKRAIMTTQPRAINVIPEGISGVRDNTRVLMAETGKFEKITRLKAGDKVLSYNSLTGRCEDANVIDVGPLTSEKSLVSFLTIVNNMGSKIDLLPDTRIRCWQGSSSNADWIRAKDVHPRYSVSLQSGPYRKGGFMGATRIVRVEKNFTHDSYFYKLEVYPHNVFFANSNKIRKLHLTEDALGAAWGFPIKGYLGQIGSLLENI